MSNFDKLRFNSKIVYLPQDDVYLLTDQTSVGVSFSHNKESLLAGSISSWVEGIDDLNKSITISGPILRAQEQGNAIFIGYDNSDVADANILRDVFSWVYISKMLKNLSIIESIKIDIGKTSSVTVSLKNFTPQIEQVENYYLYPGLEILKNEKICGDDINEILSGRSLKNFDLCVVNTSGDIITDLFVSKCSSSINFNWKPIKTIPTIYDINMDYTKSMGINDVDFGNVSNPPTGLLQDSDNIKTNASVENIPLPTMKVLQGIESTLELEMYATQNIDRNGFETWIADYWTQYPPIFIAHPSIEIPAYDGSNAFSVLDPSHSPNESSSTNNYPLLDKINTKDMLWRVTDLSARASGNDLTKYTIKMNGIFRSVPSIMDPPLNLSVPNTESYVPSAYTWLFVPQYY